jgi:hypothetical protein
MTMMDLPNAVEVLHWCLAAGYVRGSPPRAPLTPCRHRGRLHRRSPSGYVSCGCGDILIYECALCENLTTEWPIPDEIMDWLRIHEPRVARNCLQCSDRLTPDKVAGTLRVPKAAAS